MGATKKYYFEIINKPEKEESEFIYHQLNPIYGNGKEKQSNQGYKNGQKRQLR